MSPRARCSTAEAHCAHCGLPFRRFSQFLEHVRRAGHHVVPNELRRCECGTVLVAAVSRVALRCTACRWKARRHMSPDELRELANGYWRASVRFHAAGAVAAAEDHACEARTLEAEADEREADWTDPDGSSCETCGTGCSKQSKLADDTCAVCGHLLRSGAVWWMRTSARALSND